MYKSTHSKVYNHIDVLYVKEEEEWSEELEENRMYKERKKSREGVGNMIEQYLGINYIWNGEEWEVDYSVEKTSQKR